MSRCVCNGLGVYVDWNGSTSNPAYEVRDCDEHLPKMKPNALEQQPACEVAGEMIDECLDALAGVRDILWPAGDVDASWLPDTLDSIERQMTFLGPYRALAPKPAPAPQVKHVCARCGAPGVFLSPNADEHLCRKHNASIQLGGCGACLLGLVVNAETNAIEACIDCAGLGAGFGDVTHADDAGAAAHALKILKAVSRAANEKSGAAPLRHWLAQLSEVQPC